MPAVKLSKAAEQDLMDIWLFIAKDNPTAADSVLDFISAEFQALAETPTLGRVRNDLWPDALCFPIYESDWRMRYVAFYRRIPEGIEIARVIEGHRNISRVIEKR